MGGEIHHAPLSLVKGGRRISQSPFLVKNGSDFHQVPLWWKMGAKFTSEISQSIISKCHLHWHEDMYDDFRQLIPLLLLLLRVGRALCPEQVTERYKSIGFSYAKAIFRDPTSRLLFTNFQAGCWRLKEKNFEAIFVEFWLSPGSSKAPQRP